MNTHVIDTVQIVKLQGRLDAHQGKQVDNLLINARQASNRTIVNLGNVNFIDSTGLSVLIKGMKHHREAKGDMLLCELQQPVRVIFELTRLDKMFAIYATESEAIQALSL